MNRILLFSLLISVVGMQNVFAQDNMGVGTFSPDPSSLLDLSASDKGLLIPRMNTFDQTSQVQLQGYWSTIQMITTSGILMGRVGSKLLVPKAPQESMD